MESAGSDGWQRSRVLPLTWQELLDAFHRMIGKPSDDVDEVGLRIDALLAAVLD